MSSSPSKISGAFYGIGENVFNYILNKTNNNRLSIRINNELFGDTCPNKLK